ncbi:MAG: small multi-drug export protein [Elusimicrobiota bacterium]
MTETSPGTPPPVETGLFKASEWRQITFMLVLSTMTLFAIGAMFRFDERLAITLLSSIGMHLAGARAPAILFGLSRGLSPVVTLFFNFYIEVLIVVLCYYSFVLIIREGIESKFMHLAAKRAETAAQEHRNAIKRFELAGLFFLVMAPFPMTGPITGAIVGYLLNLRPWATFAIVLSGTFVALFAYVVLGKVALQAIIAFQSRYAYEVALVIMFVIAVFTIVHVRSIARWVQSAIDDYEKL